MVRSQKFRPRAGFSLIEVMIVISIILVLAALILSGIQQVMHRSTVIKCRNSLRELGTMVEHYISVHTGFLPKFSNYTWCGQIGIVKGGVFGYKPGKEYPEIALNPVLSDPSTGWMDRQVFIVYPRHDDVFRCPTSKISRMNLQGVYSSYAGLATNDYLNVLVGIDQPKKKVLLFEYDPKQFLRSSDRTTGYVNDTMEPATPSRYKPPYRVKANHGNCGQILFLDLHVACVTGKDRWIESWDDDYTPLKLKPPPPPPPPPPGGGTPPPPGTSTTVTSTTSTTVLGPWLGPPIGD